MMYYMEWKLTNAQIELLTADVSVVDYNMDTKKRKKSEFDNTSADTEAVKKAGDEWTERYGKEEGAGTGLTLNDIFGGAVTSEVGIKTS